MKKFILGVVMILGLVFATQAQSGYSTGRHYAYRGSTAKTYSGCYYNNMGQRVRNYQYRQWYQERYSGYIYTWNGSSWVYTWRTGFFWYFKWSPIYTEYCW